jgi:hypothetical protein
MRWWRQPHRKAVLILGAVLIVIGALAWVNVHHTETALWLGKNKDLLAALQCIVQMILLTIAATLAYYRFFRGRTLVSRADVTVGVTVISLSEAMNLHVIRVCLKNIGPSTIWSPRVSLRSTAVRSDGTTKRDEWREVELSDRTRQACGMVDSGETITFATSVSVPKEVPAFLYEAFAIDADNLPWGDMVGVANIALSPKTA